MLAGGEIKARELRPAAKAITFTTLSVVLGTTIIKDIVVIVLIASAFPQLGPGEVALGMAVILGNILVGPVMLKAALPQSSAVADGEMTNTDGGIGHGG